MLNILFALLNPGLLLPLAILIIIYCIADKQYKKTTYYEITRSPFLAVRFNTGKNGEYLTYKALKQQEASGAKFLFNVYIPKSNGETSEIDVMMIHQKGIFVFESKNYSGWIFGNETQRMWTQTLPAGRGRSHKESFYNPIMQNHSHIKHLQSYLEEKIPMHSVIVFSERCTLKSIQVKSSDIYVIKRSSVQNAVNKICNTLSEDILSTNDILRIYHKLLPFAQTTDEMKAQHIKNIQANKQAASVTSKNEKELQKNDTENTSNQTEASVSSKEDVHVQVSNIELPPEAETTNIERCPKCGGTLVLRTATKGANVGQQFYGCSNFPRCRYIQKKDDQPQ